MSSPDVLAILDRSNADIYLSVDALPTEGEKALLKNVDVHPGGIGGNFAANIAALGARTTVAGSATVGEISAIDHANLHSHGVRIVTDASTAGPPFQCYILLASNGQRAILIAPPPDYDRVATGVLNALSTLSSETFELSYFGVWSDQQRAALPALRSLSRLVAVTLESSAWPTEEDAFPAESFDLVFCADETYDAHIDALDRWQERGGFTLIVTRGAAGSGHRQPGVKEWEVAPAAPGAGPIVDTSGAGDCFAAAYCYGLLTGESGTALLAQANAQARTSIERLGSRPPGAAGHGQEDVDYPRSFMRARRPRR